MNHLSHYVFAILFLSLPTLSNACITIYGMGNGNDQNSVELCIEQKPESYSSSELTAEKNTQQEGDKNYENQ